MLNVGNGFGRWNTMPIFRRITTGSTVGSNRFRPSSTTPPRARAPAISSCRRLMHRMNVDLPHPGGPMLAVTDRGAMSMLIDLGILWSPNPASRFRTVMRFAASAAGATAVAAETAPNVAGAVNAGLLAGAGWAVGMAVTL